MRVGNDRDVGLGCSPGLIADRRFWREAKPELNSSPGIYAALMGLSWNAQPGSLRAGFNENFPLGEPIPRERCAPKNSGTAVFLFVPA